MSERSRDAAEGEVFVDGKPPCVHVAEALGWTGCTGTTLDDWTGVRPGGGTAEMIPRYDLYEDLLGNALRKLGLKVRHHDLEASVEFTDRTFTAAGRTPQLAVCNLIRELKAASRIR